MRRRRRRRSETGGASSCAVRGSRSESESESGVGGGRGNATWSANCGGRGSGSESASAATGGCACSCSGSPRGSGSPWSRGCPSSCRSGSHMAGLSCRGHRGWCASCGGSESASATVPLPCTAGGQGGAAGVASVRGRSSRSAYGAGPGDVVGGSGGQIARHTRDRARWRGGGQSRAGPDAQEYLHGNATPTGGDKVPCNG
jgi:hypothetical protein